MQWKDSKERDCENINHPSPCQPRIYIYIYIYIYTYIYVCVCERERESIILTLTLSHLPTLTCLVPRS